AFDDTGPQHRQCSLWMQLERSSVSQWLRLGPQVPCRGLEFLFYGWRTEDEVPRSRVAAQPSRSIDEDIGENARPEFQLPRGHRNQWQTFSGGSLHGGFCTLAPHPAGLPPGSRRATSDAANGCRMGARLMMTECF